MRHIRWSKALKNKKIKSDEEIDIRNTNEDIKRGLKESEK